VSAIVISAQNGMNEAEVERLQSLIASAQAELAKLEAASSSEKHKVGVLRATLFGLLRLHYERRDRLRLAVEYRRTFADKLKGAGSQEADKVREQFAEAEEETRREYESTAAAFAKKRELAPTEELELKALWKKLVKLFHPDTISADAAKRDTYQKLTQTINHAKDTGDLNTLREIANDPEGFIRKQGWTHVELAPEKEVEALRRLLEMLQAEIVEVTTARNRLRETPDFELYDLWRRDPKILDNLAERQKRDIEAECVELTREADELRREIEKITGEPAFGEVEETDESEGT
jgi:hypothetical protein